ncbi:hypothetical protein ASC77_09065 [Nocardioides sp. Root1257]|uniref:hypothetical protein n=1 Tax=unclassified Nocardioides TaxID=2615069 RepID=UPI0006FD6CA4|nr:MULTISPECIES: hypothetical protein [unclassified Nocardioides]KQW48863.1 hypothetical protein ASC77_09065 [Nocardioides sp. Root1257]KRC48038.1 hypothetical protein ASE24_09070 [Nocardioides sp. Root224]
MSRPRRWTLRRTALAALALVTVALTASAAPGSAMTTPAADPVGRAAGADKGWTGTQTFAREFVNFDGSDTTFNNPLTAAPYKMTVHVDHTQNLRGRERVAVSWTGAQQSAGRASDPYGANGMNQEYPVVVLQCRGQGEEVTPETCWTSSVGQRSQVSVSQSAAVWREDEYGTDADKALVGGMSTMPSAEDCPSVDTSGLLATHLTPFIDAKGKVYSACDAAHMPPEAAVDSAFPPAEIAAFSDADGSGSLQFELRTDIENESLGCNQKTPCSIVVVPIAGISCDQASTASTFDMTPVEKACRKTGQFLPGSSNLLGAPDAAVAPVYWWSASNWRNRFEVPVTFGPPPDVCDVLDSRAPTGFYGSELLSQAALQWSPAYCLNKKRFKFQLNQMSDEAGWELMASGGGAAALVSSQHPVNPGADPVGYAPVAATGFAVGYTIDKPGNTGEYGKLRLNARLLAKLMTLSYTGSTFGAQHPGMADNPAGIQADPEFQKLNPHLSTEGSEAGAALLSLSNSSDIIAQLTSYIATDKDAMAFINGKADPWGMKVNPSYKKLSLPRAEWPLLDDFVPAASTQCQQANPQVYFNNVAAPVSTLRKVSDALLDGWPNTQTRCDSDNSTDPPTFKLGRVDRQPYGKRFLLGVVSLGDAARYGLRAAALETKKGSYVGPTDSSLAAALKLSTQKKKYGPFVLDQADVRKSRSAYPGTMVVYTAARLQNLDKADATKVAQFIEVSTTEGQQQGSGNGELPGGFLPIRKTGVTAPYYASAQEVAAAVAAQKAPSAEPTGNPTSGAGTGGGSVAPPPAVPTAPAPSASASPSAVPSAPPAATPMPATQPVGSDLAGGLLPALILIGAVGCAATALIRVGAPFLRGRR